MFQRVLSVETSGCGFVDITRDVDKLVSESGFASGLCTRFVQHSSASLTIQENADPAVLRDLERFMKSIVPRDRGWEHDDEGPDDMPAHVRSVLTSTSETIPILDGALALGTWQAIYLWEHRDRMHQRQIVVHLTGE